MTSEVVVNTGPPAGVGRVTTRELAGRGARLGQHRRSMALAGPGTTPLAALALPARSRARAA